MAVVARTDETDNVVFGVDAAEMGTPRTGAGGGGRTVDDGPA